MKRDMDLIRKMVLLIEDGEHGLAPDPIRIEGYTDEQIGYHQYLLVDAELAAGERDIGDRSDPRPTGRVDYLTWKGHEFADAARNEKIWNMAKKTIKEKIGTVTITVLTEYLQKLAKSAIGL